MQVDGKASPADIMASLEAEPRRSGTMMFLLMMHRATTIYAAAAAGARSHDHGEDRAKQAAVQQNKTKGAGPGMLTHAGWLLAACCGERMSARPRSPSALPHCPPSHPHRTSVTESLE